MYTHGERIAYNKSVVTCCNPCSRPYKHDGFDKRACGVWDGFIIGLPVTCLPCRAPSSVWRINLLSFSPPALHTSCLRISYSSPNSVSSHTEWRCNLMKWEKGQDKERQTVPRTSQACLFIKKCCRWCRCCWVQHGGWFTETLPLPPWYCPGRAQRCHVGCWVITLCRGCGVSAQLRGASLFPRKRAILHAWLVQSGIKHKLFLSGLCFMSRRSKTKHYVKLLIQHKRVCVYTSVICFYSCTISNPQVVSWPQSSHFISIRRDKGTRSVQLFIIAALCGTRDLSESLW